jgi:hypothetical protein
MTAERRLRELQSSLYESNERKIRGLVSTPRRFARDDLDSYEHELLESIPVDWTPSTPGALRQAIRRSQIILVGDYHTLRQSQRGFLRVLRSVGSRRLIVGLEFVAARYQRAVDQYMEGRIDDDTFLRRVEYKKSWPSYQVWPSFEPIFAYARRRDARVLALDCLPGECGTVFSRADFTAWRIAEMMRENPRHKIAVLMGETHLAPAHLPASLRRALDRMGLKARILTIHQNLDPLYFEMAARGIESSIDVVRLGEDRFVLPASSPIAAQHSFLAAMTGDDYSHVPDRDAVRREFMNYLRALGRLLGLDTEGIIDGITVCGPGDLEIVVELAAKLGEEVWAYVSAQIADGESICLPEAGLIYLSTLAPTHVAEEAAHCLKARLGSGPVPDDPNDYLYSRTLHEALGYFGAKLFNPKRKPPTETLLRSPSSTDLDSEDYPPEVIFAAQMAAWHRKRQRRKGFVRNTFDHYLRALGLPDGIADLGPDVMRPLVHLLGYETGERLYQAFREGRMEASRIQVLFRANLEAPGEAFDLYHGLATSLRSIRLPARF